MFRTIEIIYGPLHRIERTTGQLASKRVRLSIGAKAVSFLRDHGILSDNAADRHVIDLRTELEQLKPNQIVGTKTFAEIRPRFIGYVASAPQSIANFNKLLEAAEATSEMHRSPVTGKMLRFNEEQSGIIEQAEVAEADVQTIANLMDFTISRLQNVKTNR